MLVQMDIRPASFGVEQRLAAVKIATEMGYGVRMVLQSAHTVFYADPEVPVGKVTVFAPPEYKAWPVYVATLDSPEDIWPGYPQWALESEPGSSEIVVDDHHLSCDN